jgi:hypothetical protein
VKDPSATHFPVNSDDWQDECAEDSKIWPCKTIRKWWTTKQYRLKTLEGQVQRLGLSNAALRKEGSDLRTAYRELDLIVNGGLIMAVADLMNGRKGQLTVSRTVDTEDLDMMGSSYPIRVAGRVDFKVRYEAADGAVWENKQLVERNTPTWP